MAITHQKTTEMAKELFREERSLMRLDGWFLSKEIGMKYEHETEGMSKMRRTAYLLKKVAAELPISISDNAVFAGTQRDAFARSYALINPSFRVETFSGYCDPTAVFGDIEPNEDITKERLDTVKAHDKKTDYIKDLTKVYDAAENYTKEVAFFIEQVTGHVIPDMRHALAVGVNEMKREIEANMAKTDDAERTDAYLAMLDSLDAVLIFAARYREIALEKANGDKKEQFTRLADALARVPAEGARNLFEAIQSFILMWQVMCLEQAPNPFAFSVGNADRIFEPYRAMEDLSREDTAALFKHLLVFYNVADRSWAISQNLIVGGKDTEGNDLTNLCSYALLDAYYDMNLPQPILSVKLHKNTPDKLYEELGRFFFTPGCLTPSLFNDDSVFDVLRKAGVDECDLADYSVAGCQEPLIMGKDNANTTNSWLNLGKILELTLSDGVSTITGERILPATGDDATTILKNLRERFYANCQFIVKEMTRSANGASRALSNLPVPFLSTLMGGIESGYDMRDPVHQGTKYNGSGCLIHGLSIIADSFIAVDTLLAERPQDAERLISALANDFKDDEELREYLLGCKKYGNNIAVVDDEAAEVASKVADMVAAEKNYLGNPFRPDFSSPSTHLTYGYWVGALPDGRKAREMMNYGVDPLFGDAHQGLGFRVLSSFKLPYIKMNGGFASHFGIDPNYFTGATYEEKGIEFKNKVMRQFFFNPLNDKLAPFYLYVNVTTPEMLRKVLANPKKYAPSGVYIMRIHGTFVNFLDLSPAIQQDIIKRLDLKSTTLEC